MMKIFDTWNNVISDSRNQLVFVGRNREYGAYQLRTEYNNRILLSMLITFVFFIIISLIPKISFTKIEEKKFKVETIILNEPIATEKKEIIKKPVAITGKKESGIKSKTTKFLVPEINPSSNNIDPPPIQSDINGGISSNNNNNAGDSSQVSTILDDGMNGDFLIVDVLATPRGGFEKFYEYVSQNFRYPQRCRDEGIWGYVVLKFKVDIMGNISDISAIQTTSDCPEFTTEAIRVLKQSPKWIPAQSGGTPIEAWRTLPIQLQVESEEEFN